MTEQIKSIIDITDFAKMDIKVGTIETCEHVPNSEKLLKLLVDFGKFGKRQILSGIAKWFDPAELVGIQTTFILNLKPREMMGLSSEGMLMAAESGSEEKPVLLFPSTKMENGSSVI